LFAPQDSAENTKGSLKKTVNLPRMQGEEGKHLLPRANGMKTKPPGQSPFIVS